MIATLIFAAVILVTAIGTALIAGFIIAPAIEGAIQLMKRARLKKREDNDTI